MQITRRIDTSGKTALQNFDTSGLTAAIAYVCRKESIEQKFIDEASDHAENIIAKRQATRSKAIRSALCVARARQAVFEGDNRVALRAVGFMGCGK